MALRKLWVWRTASTAAYNVALSDLGYIDYIELVEHALKRLMARLTSLQVHGVSCKTFCTAKVWTLLSVILLYSGTTIAVWLVFLKPWIRIHCQGNTQNVGLLRNCVTMEAGNGDSESSQAMVVADSVMSQCQAFDVTLDVNGKEQGLNI